MEYDRNQNDYSPSSPSGDRYTYQRAYWNGSAKVNGSLVQTVMSDTNKAEVDCLLCHLDGANNGLAWLKTMNCGTGNPIGPSNDPTCTGTSSVPGVPAANLNFTAGSFYDMFNRNAAIKDAKFNFAASMGLGAKGTMDAQGHFTGVTGIPGSIPGTMISYTPKSKNCSVCHARDDSTLGLPGMMAMKYGYGNFNTITPPGAGLDTDKVATPGSNDKLWFELGCKTGMGKRAHRIGAGPNDKWGMSMFVPSTFDGSCNHLDKPCMGDPIPNKMPDADVHDMDGMQCATCHYALGSTLLSGGEITIPAATHHGLSFPAQTIFGVDHMVAQADSSPDTKSRNNLDGTVSCEGCHITRDHPRIGKTWVNAAGVTEVFNPPIPTHSGFPALHIQNIACATCHIPEVYAAPGRLKYRDWGVGEYKGGFRNMLDWNYDLVTGSHKTVPLLHQWLTKYGEKKIYPVLPSVMPNWVKSQANAGIFAGSDTTDDTIYTGSMSAPVFHRDVTAVAQSVKAAHPEFDIRINGGNIVPLFDGFSLSDSWEIDTKTEIDTMLAVPGFAAKMRLYNTMFDVTHGVAPKEWALGGVNQGGCVSCHSSANPMSPVYSPKSVAFFESYQQPLNKAGMGIGQYDLIKNWFALFADYDCTAYCGMGTQGDSAFFDPAGNVITGAACSAGSPFAVIDQCTGYMQQTFDAAMGFPSGTAQMMGMNDGIAGLQGFTIRETVSGSTLGCNPFAGPISFSPVPGQSVNACMPSNNPMFTAGVCEGATQTTPGMCNNMSFRYKGACMNNADCNGTTFATAPVNEYAANPNGLLYQRGEVRSHFKIAFQQTAGGAMGSPVTAANAKVTWPIAVEKNPSNPAHAASWDQALKCVDQMGSPTACTDGGYIQTTVNGNDFLGYTPAYLTYLTSLVINPVPCPEAIAYMSKSYDPADPTNMTIIFDGSASLLATSYTWDFGDGATGSGITATHAYTAEGTYDVKLTVTGDCGGPSTAISQVTIKAVPVAAYTTAVNNLTVTFDGTASLNAATYAWDFGDGSPVDTTSGATVIHAYGAAGTYNVSLTVTSAGGSTSKKIGQITVGKLVPICSFNVSYDPADPAKRTIIFDATASTNASTYEWTFGDTGTGSGVIVTHAYGAAGTYYPTLKVTSPTGHTCTKNSRIILK